MLHALEARFQILGILMPVPLPPSSTAAGLTMIATLAKQSPTLVLVLLVWYSLQTMAGDLREMNQSLAILVSRE